MNEIERIYRRGIAEAGRWYRAALAAQVREEPEEAEEAWERYAEVLGQVLTLSALAGRAVAYASAKAQGADWEAEEWPEDRPEAFAVARTGFAVGPFWEAIRRFRGRIPISWGEVQRIRAEVRSIANRIAITENQNALKEMRKRIVALRETMSGAFRIKGATWQQAARIQSLIADAIESKTIPKALKTGSLSAFIRRAQIEGIVGMTSARLETVYRTNVASAYNEATVDAMSGPDVARWAPLLRLVEIHDRRTRGAPGGVYKSKRASRNPGSHWQMDGYIATAEDFRRQGLIPPNGFNCRGSVTPVTYDEAEEMGFVRRDGSLDRAALDRYNTRRQQIIDRGEYPDPGFKQ